jgi:stage III sporulation protein AB
MSIRIIGSILIIITCTATGFSIAGDFKREERQLQQLIHALDYMGNELQMRLTPLPQLFRLAQQRCAGVLQQVFHVVADKMDEHSAQSATFCLDYALDNVPKLAPHTKNALKQFSHSLGRFDLPGQLQGLESTKRYCTTVLNTMSLNRDSRLRSYQTLGFCCGIAIAIIFI